MGGSIVSQRGNFPSQMFASNNADRIWARSTPCEKAASVIYGLATVALGLLTFAYTLLENDSIVEMNYGARFRTLPKKMYREFHYPSKKMDKYLHVPFLYTTIDTVIFAFQIGLLVGSITSIFLSKWKRNVSPEECKGSYNRWRAITIIHGITYSGIGYFARYIGYEKAGILSMALAGTELSYAAFETFSRRNKNSNKD